MILKLHTFTLDRQQGPLWRLVSTESQFPNQMQTLTFQVWRPERGGELSHQKSVLRGSVLS